MDVPFSVRYLLDKSLVGFRTHRTHSLYGSSRRKGSNSHTFKHLETRVVRTQILTHPKTAVSHTCVIVFRFRPQRHQRIKLFSMYSLTALIWLVEGKTSQECYSQLAHLNYCTKTLIKIRFLFFTLRFSAGV